MEGNNQEYDDRLNVWARMAHKRKEVAPPDVDDAWKRFAREQMSVKAPTVAHKQHKKINPWWPALMGAAAMWMCIFIFYHYITPWWQQAFPDEVVAFNYDQAPREMIFKDNDIQTSLKGMDSINFSTSQVAGLATENTHEQVNDKEDAGNLRSLSTPRGMSFKVTLCDGTEVYLNAESSLEFPTAFSKKERRVKVSGEAFFKVAHSDDVPFVVMSEAMDVRVYGTEFNVRTYKEDNPCVSLINGSVEVVDHAQGRSYKLAPGQKAINKGTSEWIVEMEDTYNVTQWVYGFFYFDGAPLVDVLQEMGRWYNYGVVFRSPKLMNYMLHFSASRDESVEQAVQHLNLLRKFVITIEGNNLVVSESTRNRVL